MGFRATPFEAVGGGAERVVQRSLAQASQLLGLTMVNAVRRHIADA